ncbi:hypothetical protein F7725_017838 [Dissostichus mawsoni]|uniref:Uncharacterized protein n=1 Tax=Dissostichus mawsoni TaxID=36200 RepID=A0A7J5XQA7_DISMA|nr:hypothetical protein F7725_017838 [Dissostichus mawsoni]
MFSYCSHDVDCLDSVVSDKSVNLVRRAGFSLSPAAMRSITLLLLDGEPGKKLEKTAKERIQIWLLHVILLKSLMFKYLTTLSLFSRKQSMKKALDLKDSGLV